MKYKDIISQLTLEEKAGLCSGKNFWSTKGVERLEINEVVMTDGPHGLRKVAEKGEKAGVGGNVPATCFLPAVTSAASWDTGMLYRMGQLIAEEAAKENVQVLLGPGLNIKRNPLCGRNFEYFSEDPYLAGKLGASFVKGVQSQGVGATLKHFAANNQETRRQTIDSVVDERTLREIYLRAFEIAVKDSNPRAIMNAYNKLNGTYCAENRHLLFDVLRKDWRYNGLVMTDWGAENDRVEALKVLGNLEMPSSDGINDEKIVQAVRNGELDERILDENVDIILDFAFKAKESFKPRDNYDKKEHHAFVRKAAANSMVLLKNEENILPITKGKKVAIIGDMAENPRFQGAGSSFISATELDSARSIFKNEFKYEPAFAQGYRSDTDEVDEELEAKAVVLAGQQKDRIILLYVGLTDIYEAEAYDRSHMRLPDNQLSLIEKVCKVNENVVIVLHCGSPVEMPFIDNVKGVLCCYLGGQAGAGAAIDILYGKTNPSGKLAETFPLSYSDVPSAPYFPSGPRTVEYREGLFVGYRYYDSVNKDVLFPFGFGLSYTSFEFSDISISNANIRDDDTVTVSFNVKNTGEIDGAEVCQLYVGAEGSDKIFRPRRELRAFTKVFLKAGEQKQINLELDGRAFSYFNVLSDSFEVETGRYHIFVGDSIDNLTLVQTLRVTNTTGAREPDYKKITLSYFGAECKNIPDEEFKALIGRELPENEFPEDYVHDINSTFADMTKYAGGRFINKWVYKIALKFAPGDTAANKKMAASMLLDSPLRASALMSGGGFTLQMARDIVKMCNGHFLSGLPALLCHTIFKGRKKKKAEPDERVESEGENN